MRDSLHRKKARVWALLMAVVLALSLAVPQIAVQAAPNEVVQAALGIDVSRYQGAIDWDQVAASGVQFAMIRVGYRTQSTGILNEDPYARYNLQEAQRVGLKVGAYFFSAAVNEAEAVEEAVFTANLIDKYKITFPVAYDCEGFRDAASRQHALGRDVRTALAVTFLDTIAARGYTPMFYASKSEMTDSKDWNMNILNRYKVWVSQYPSDPFPITPASSYTGVQAMWQYTCKAAIPGIAGDVDMNVSYFNYDGIAEPKDPSGAELVSAANAANVQYLDVNEVVTPNTKVNLRTVPGTDSPATIVVPINPGDMIFRTGIGNNGWSRVVLN
ncbi:MAG: glycoside hydrolase family 25, partial [Lachnospiraceae bacterium]|nr:glycoside hydrolase family 25 [Lachnospiraceae bacterium]